MALVLGEGQLATTAELVLGARRLPIDCRITVEWLRGIEEPTWYGYFTVQHELRMLPGAYQLTIRGVEFRILLRRCGRNGIPDAIPFWGLGEPPDVPRVAENATVPLSIEAGQQPLAFRA
jgi:hypothetical protein